MIRAGPHHVHGGGVLGDILGLAVRRQPEHGKGSEAKSAISVSAPASDSVSGAVVAVIGAGFGGLAAARSLAGLPVAVTILDRLNYHLFQPLLYQVAMAGLSPNEIAVPIRSILWRQRNAQVVLAEVTEIHLRDRRLMLSDGSEFAYDFLIISAGARTNYYGHDDWIAFAPGLKDLDDALEVRRRVLLAFEAAERERDPPARRRLLTFVIVGAGPTGVELAGAIADLSRDILARDFRHIDPAETRVVIVEMAPRVLTPFSERLAASAADQLRELGVEIRTGTAVTAIDERGVHLGSEIIASTTVLWTAGVRPSPLAERLGTPLDRAGRVVVEQDCSIPGYPEAFVIGDMAGLVPAGASAALPGISPVAMQMGRSVAANIRRTLAGAPRKPFKYLDKGFMATIGRGRAIAQLRGLALTRTLAFLAWALLHLWYLIGFRNRLVVFVDWLWSYLMAKHGARLITGRQLAPPTPPPTPVPTPTSTSTSTKGPAP
jgi:NADH dehydrogenase